MIPIRSSQILDLLTHTSFYKNPFYKIHHFQIWQKNEEAPNSI